jgi:hypothetical protein
VSVWLEPTVTTAPVVGTLTVIVGDVGVLATLTVTETAEEVTIVPLLSVTLAVRAAVPAAKGVQLTLYGAVVSVAIETPSAKNWTLAMVVPTPAVALALTVTAVLTVAVELLLGEEIVTVGAAARTVTVRVAAVLFPLSSVAIAVKETVLAVVGVHETENGAERSVAMSSPSA